MFKLPQPPQKKEPLESFVDRGVQHSGTRAGGVHPAVHDHLFSFAGLEIGVVVLTPVGRRLASSL